MLDEENLAVYVNNQLVSTIPKKGEAMYIKSVCDELDNDRMFFPYTGYTGYCENEYIRKYSK